jgi:ribose transport system substrate-binding protein
MSTEEGSNTFQRREFLKRGAALGLGLSAGGLAGAAQAATPIAGETTHGDLAWLAGVKPQTNLNFMDASNNDFWISFRQGLEEACHALGIKFKTAVSDYDPAKQRSFFENAPTQGVKTATGTPTDEAGSAKLIRILTDQGIRTVTFNSNAPWSTPLDVSPLHIQYLAVANFDGAYAMAKSLFQKMGGKGKFVHIQGILGLSHDTDRTLGVDKALKEFPNVKLVARQPGKYNRVDAQKVMEDIITRVGKVDGVFVQNDDGAIGVRNALKAHGQTVPIAAVDGIAEWLDLIAKGDDWAYGTWAFHPRYGSALLVVTAFDAYNGWKPSVPERMMGFGSCIVDTPKAAKLYRKIVFADKSPWDYRKMSRVLHPKDFDTQVPVFPRDPNVFWATRKKEKPAGYKLPTAYNNKAQFTKVKGLYAAHFKKNPLAPVLAASNYKKWVV